MTIELLGVRSVTNKRNLQRRHKARPASFVDMGANGHLALRRALAEFLQKSRPVRRQLTRERGS
jgi:hypothetical protein